MYVDLRVLEMYVGASVFNCILVIEYSQLQC